MKAAFLLFFLLCAPAAASADGPLADLLAGLSPFAAGDTGTVRPPLSVPAEARQPRVDAPGVSAAGFISIWAQDCPAGVCALPQPLMPARQVSFEMVLPNGPGQAQRKEVSEVFAVDGAGELKVKLSFYSICPYGASEGCPSRYFQVQAELSGAAAAFCAASLNAGDFLPFPVFMCAGVPAPGKRLGITLHRI